MVRSTMTELIDRVQLLVDDLAAATWSEEQVEDALDRRRVHHNNHELKYGTRLLPGNVLAYKDYFSPYGYWEKDGVLRDGSGATVSPDASGTDWLLGYWYFGTGQTPPVYMDGKTYDVYGAAADLLFAHAAKLKLEFDFSDGITAVGRKDGALSQRYNQVIELARQYLRKSKGRTVHSVRGDLNVTVR